MSYCDITGIAGCDPHYCYAVGGRCLPEIIRSMLGTEDFARRCRQGIREPGTTLRFRHWNLRKDLKVACRDCSCRMADPSIIQTEQELREFVATHVKPLDDVDNAALKQKFEGNAALCKMGGQVCDVTQCSADGIRCLMSSSNKCAPHFGMNGHRTSWVASSTPATCRGCSCRRKLKLDESRESYMLFGVDLRQSASTKNKKVG
jgi:hypothetical protein